ncbi:hypothetical protein BLNAU_19560 [Blattamonas nauphoetae]|uniref:Uncharacterized protein n=1 Tax=Blattamonas nauphoetae TaxID=2049346 RepID=A0ABQ9X1C7_9EUKA|nr:hypothetical protein BLNAU_19560 [Blattamonas nauphoetae]
MLVLSTVSTVPEAKLSIWEWKRDDEHQLGASSLDNEYRQHIISSLRFTVDLQVELPTSAPSQRDSAFLTNHKTQIHSTSPANLQCDLMCHMNVGNIDEHILHCNHPFLMIDPTISTLQEVRRLTNQDQVTALIVTQYERTVDAKK